MDLNKIKEASDFIKSKLNYQPEIGVILGSGLGDMAEGIENKVIIKYNDIPHFPVSTVQGHAGQFVIGDYKGRKVIMMQGRFHFYEGNPMQTVVMPVYVMKLIGVSKLIVTNAAGGVNTSFNPGDLMIITDHINFSGDNPLIGKNYEEIGPRFPDMSQAYSRRLVEKAIDASEKLSLKIQKGVYMMFSGPTYETPAEIKMARKLGADAVGMSTVPEVIAANHCGIETLGISCITNMAAGILDQPLNHEEVIETSAKVKANFIELVSNIISDL
ncbi:purine-nucleoside phosphorylase [Clostridium polynesiense]|uniref:purine-nucleoside phosphorylase n=1 Tax=Clostridium polynesiense TaxID=1325933 RepID=UPI00058B3787|nr:purine-nucleoside phosphorylase [Clostridium polynesiense]